VEKGQVRLLLDTDALIWTFANPARLSAYAAEKIEDRSNDVLVSVVSVWEIGVKRAKRKLDMPGDLKAMIVEKEFEPLPLALRHGLAVEALPHQHHDPFDRMLIAQAQVEGLTLVTSDREMRHYPISVLPAI
jgi:PIN domain nuclease of toxin-antitoxin system